MRISHLIFLAGLPLAGMAAADMPRPVAPTLPYDFDGRQVPCCISPEEAVMRAASTAPAAFLAKTAFTVRAQGQDHGLVFLNSELDYRDPRNISLVLSPRVQAQLRYRDGDDFARRLVGRNIMAIAAFKRVRIDFTVDGRPSGKYYYQTHARIRDIDDLRIVE